MGQPVGVVFTCLLLFGGVSTDIFLHVPRGSNNRLNEVTENRKNAQRLYDSQDNNKGGYNVGDKTDQPFNRNEGNQYQMKYFQSGPYKSGDDARSFLQVEWTNQHGCGNHEDTNCNIVLQYMCQDDADKATADTFRNGLSTTTQGYSIPNPGNVDKIDNRKSMGVKSDRGLHESWNWYDKCYLRERNNGLFTADQNLNTIRRFDYSSAIHTRQNAAGTRYGYECPEERDYYPYWHPNPWIDIAVLVDRRNLCRSLTRKSFNRQAYHECIEPNGWSRYNNEQDCTANNGQWLLLYSYLEKATDITSKDACESDHSNGLTYKWAVAYDSTNGYSPECLVLAPTPVCNVAPWTRPNHLGNTDRGGETSSYKWTLPYFPSGKDKKCVFRIRYNISSADYDPFTTDSTHNQDDANNVQSPIQGNPEVEIVNEEMPKLRLAVNTAQFGRTFQDRSHVFQLRSRDQTGIDANAKLYNVNVRGKRGNIVQTFPAVEYDFAPNTLRIKQGDLVHFQWTGSNTHRNGNNAAGEGRQGTDRSNVVEMLARAGNFPVPFGQSTMWDAVEVVWIYHGQTGLRKEDLAINMASSGYYQCATKQQCGAESVQSKAAISNMLDNAPASYEGVVLKFTEKGTYHYMSTRNNNFSNRNQKAAIIVQ